MSLTKAVTAICPTCNRSGKRDCPECGGVGTVCQYAPMTPDEEKAILAEWAVNSPVERPDPVQIVAGLTEKQKQTVLAAMMADFLTPARAKELL